MLKSSDFKEVTSDAVVLEGDHTRSIDIWFRAIHDAIHSDYTVPLAEMWHIVAAGDKYDLDIKLLWPWFAKWYDLQNISILDARQLLYPCYTFNHAQGFMSASKKLVYGTIGHINEKNPTELFELHLQPRIMRKSRCLSTCRWHEWWSLKVYITDGGSSQ